MQPLWVYFYNYDSTLLLPSVAPCNSLMLNCSQPDLPSLFEALKPVFTLSSIRPVMNTSTPTRVSIDFIMYGILGVVSDPSLLTDL